MGGLCAVFVLPLVAGVPSDLSFAIKAKQADEGHERRVQAIFP